MKNGVNSERQDGGTDMRGAKRYALLVLRSAKLVADGVEYLCIARDISTDGVRLRLFQPVPPCAELSLETSDGALMRMEPVWEHDGQAGFRFIEPVDVTRFLVGTGRYPKRAVRLRVHHPAVVQTGGETIPATILDISRQGARLEIARKLAIGQKMQLSARELPTFDATVCWRHEPHYGVAFAQLMTLEELAQRTSRMDRWPPDHEAALPVARNVRLA